MIHSGLRFALIVTLGLLPAILSGCVHHQKYPGDWPTRVSMGRDGCPDVAGMYMGPPSELAGLDWERASPRRPRYSHTLVEVIQRDVEVEIRFHEKDGTTSTRVFRQGEEGGYECVEGTLRLSYPSEYVSGFGVDVKSWDRKKSLTQATDGSLVVETSERGFGLVFMIPFLGSGSVFQRLLTVAKAEQQIEAGGRIDRENEPLFLDPGLASLSIPKLTVLPAASLREGVSLRMDLPYLARQNMLGQLRRRHYEDQDVVWGDVVAVQLYSPDIVGEALVGYANVESDWVLIAELDWATEGWGRTVTWVQADGYLFQRSENKVYWKGVGKVRQSGTSFSSPEITDLIRRALFELSLSFPPRPSGVPD